jgi:FkbM family methyltransferase
MPADERAPAVETRAEEERILRKSVRAARKAELAARESFFAQARELTPYLSVFVGEEVFFVSTDDLGVGRRVFVRRGRRDMKSLAKTLALLTEMGHRLPDDATFVDVGANIGTTTVAALRRHGFATGVALEPSPGNFQLLRLNLAANGLDGPVRALQVAADDEPGVVALDVSGANHGGHHVRTGLLADRAASVESVTLDGLVESGVLDPERIGLLWVDTPGSESRVLVGAARLLREGVPTVVTIRPREIETRGALVDLLTAAYTDVIELRKSERRLPIGELAALSASYQHKGDVLLVRRR